MTSDINDWYSVTVFHAEKVGPKRWRARAHAFRRDRPDTPQNRVGEEFVGFGQDFVLVPITSTTL